MRSRAPALGFAAFCVYLGLSVAARRWYRNWGASADEVRDPLPGDGLVAAAAMQTTGAITIAATPGQVWRWLAQMGQGRGGLYTYTWVENLLRADIHNLDRIDPDLQQLRVGDGARLTRDPYVGRIPGQFYTVAEIRPEEALVLLQHLAGGAITSWSFVLRPPVPDKTRLIVRARASAPAGTRARAAPALELLLLEPGYFVMERGMLRGIRRRAETVPPRAPHRER